MDRSLLPLSVARIELSPVISGKFLQVYLGFLTEHLPSITQKSQTVALQSNSIFTTGILIKKTSSIESSHDIVHCT